MMSIKNICISSCLLLFLANFTACKQTPTTGGEAAPTAPESTQQAILDSPLQQIDDSPANKVLPVRYQTPAYMVDLEHNEEIDEEASSTLKVGASIRSTRGPQPLWDILKRLAALKKMNVSWASDVDQNVLVDVDINASDDFYGSIDNLLRQVDYFHEMEGNTIVVKYKETRRFHVAMPFSKQNYSTGVGGNVLGNDEESNNIDGTIELKSSNNEFDIWKNVQENMDAIISTWNTTATTKKPTVEATATEGAEPDAAAEPETQLATRQMSAGGSMYIIDKPVGMITVTAPRPLLERLDIYFRTLKNELYKQITIEAKIIEVVLSDSSSIGINWSDVLKNFNISGTVNFGYNGQVYPFISANENNNGYSSYGYNDTGTDYETYSSIDAHQQLQDPGRFISKVTLGSQNFDVFLNALKEQGDTKILSNPKISVMNGQPALITVGRNVTYVDSIDSDLDTDTGVITYSVETERILSGIGMSLTATILDNKQIIMNLVPVTSELVEPIDYLAVGNLGGSVGLPVVNVREMSTTVKVNSGEMLVIGGLISNTEESTGEFAPILGDIPLVRYLFGYEEKVQQKRELIVLLKPRII